MNGRWNNGWLLKKQFKIQYMSLSGKDYMTPIPFVNSTSYQVGQIRNHNSEKFVVSAILRVTDSQFQIYGVPFKADLKLKEFEKYQSQRESGRLNVYIPGKLIILHKSKELK